MAIYIDNKKVSPIIKVASKPKQSKVINPTIENQKVTPDTGYELSEVLVTGVTSDIDVNIVPDNIAKDVTILGVTGTFEGGIKPEGTIEITTNGNYDVTNYANANVSISGSSSSGDRLQWKCDNARSLYYEFYGYTGESLDDVLNGLDTINVKNMSYMFYNCSNLYGIPQLNTKNVTKMQNVFYGCNKLISIPELDTSSCTDMSYMFYDCYKLSEIPQLNTENVTTTSSMFRNCQDIITIPVLDTRKVVDMNKMFSSANNLKTIEGIYMDSVTRNTDFLSYNSKLETLNLYNIKLSLTIGFGTTWGHLLSVDSLVGCCKECVQQSSAKTLTVGTANLEKLANVYVKLLEDDGSGKLPCEVCESTDDGAMLIADYMMLKNWSLA